MSWSKGFRREVFPALLGKKPLGSERCACGGGTGACADRGGSGSQQTCGGVSASHDNQEVCRCVLFICL